MLSGTNSDFDMVLTFEQRTISVNSIGEQTETWSTYKKVFGKRLWKPVEEQMEARQVVGFDKMSFKIRYDVGVNSTMRMKIGQETTYLYLVSVEHWRRENFSNVTAERRDNQ